MACVLHQSLDRGTVSICKSAARVSRTPLDCSTDDPGLREFWQGLSLPQRQQLLRIERQQLFKRIRTLYCSRCYGLFQMRYEELKSNCPACQDCFFGLTATVSGALSVADEVVEDPFATFAAAHARDHDRRLALVTGGDICGSSWQKKPGHTCCSLHTSPVPYEALTDYWSRLPPDHRAALLSLPEEDFVAELDAQLKYQLKICKDCRGNVMRAYRDLRPSRAAAAAAAAGGGGAGDSSAAGVPVPLCAGHELLVSDGKVVVSGPGGAALLEKAEDVEDHKAFAPDDTYGGAQGVRHAETPELAREALADAAALIFKGQLEVAFREQTAGHNALLLLVHLALSCMEEQVHNAYKELRVRKAEMELLQLLEQDAAKEEHRKAKRKQKKANKAAAVGESEAAATAAAVADSAGARNGETSSAEVPSSSSSSSSHTGSSSTAEGSPQDSECEGCSDPGEATCNASPPHGAVNTSTPDTVEVPGTPDYSTERQPQPQLRKQPVEGPVDIAVLPAGTCCQANSMGGSSNGSSPSNRKVDALYSEMPAASTAVAAAACESAAAVPSSSGAQPPLPTAWLPSPMPQLQRELQYAPGYAPPAPPGAPGNKPVMLRAFHPGQVAHPPFEAHDHRGQRVYVMPPPPPPPPYSHQPVAEQYTTFAHAQQHGELLLPDMRVVTPMASNSAHGYSQQYHHHQQQLYSQQHSSLVLPCVHQHTGFGAAAWHGLQQGAPPGWDDVGSGTTAGMGIQPGANGWQSSQQAPSLAATCFGADSPGVPLCDMHWLQPQDDAVHTGQGGFSLFENFPSTTPKERQQQQQQQGCYDVSKIMSGLLSPSRPTVAVPARACYSLFGGCGSHPSFHSLAQPLSI